VERELVKVQRLPNVCQMKTRISVILALVSVLGISLAWWGTKE
jgi:hypothetical protein